MATARVWAFVDSASGANGQGIPIISGDYAGGNAGRLSPLTFTATAARAGPMPANTGYIVFESDTDGFYRVGGATVVATTADLPIVAKSGTTPLSDHGIAGGQYISFVTA